MSNRLKSLAESHPYQFVAGLTVIAITLALAVIVYALVWGTA